MGLAKPKIIEIQNKDFTDQEIKEIQKFLRHMLSGVKLDEYIKIFNYLDFYSIDSYTQKMFTVKELLSFDRLKEILNRSHFEPINLFYSVNTYKEFKNASEDKLGAINNILIDIDYKKSFLKDLSKDAFINLLEREYFGIEIPCPSAVIYTGNNFHIDYKIKYPVSATNKAKTLAKRIQNEICKKLADFNADRAVNLTTSTRFLNTYNSKTMEKVTGKIYKDKLYELRELQNYLPELPSWYEKWKEDKKNNNPKKKKIVNLFNLHSLLTARLFDLEKIQELRNYSCHGYRELMCFLYRNFAMQKCLIGENPECAAKEAEKMMLQFNLKFRRPLMENHVESKTRNVERKQYNFRNENIITILGITEGEQRELKTIITEEEYERRQKEYNRKRSEARKEKRKNIRENEQGLMKREQEKQKKINDIKELIEKNPTMKQKEISEILGISKTIVSRYIKLLND